MNRAVRLVPHAVVLVASTGIMIVELVAGRLVAKYLGNSLYTWTGVIGVVLGGISLGNWFGGRLADRFAPRRLMPWILLASSGLTVLILALDPLVALLTRTVAAGGMTVGILARSLATITVLFFLPAASLGMVSPVMAKYAIEASSGVGTAVGGVYAAGSLGSIGGTFLAGYLLIPAFGLSANIVTVGIILAALSLLMGGRRILSGAWLLALVLLLATGAPARLARWLAERVQSGTTRVLFEKDSAYSYIQVADKSLAAGTERTLRLDALIHNRYDPQSPDTLLYQYERVFAALTAAWWRDTGGGPFATLTLGGGALSLPVYLERHYPAATHTVVEIDPEVVRTARSFFGVPAGARLRIVVEDARRYVEEARGGAACGVIYLDAFNAYSVPAHLTTREFVTGVDRLLAPDGIFLANVIDIFDSGRFLAAYLATVEAVFPQAVVYAATGSRWDARATFVVAATRGRPLPSVLRGADGNEIASAVPRGKLAELARRRPRILTDDYAPVENLMAPVFLRSVK
jgi:predicted membrane-bound spermidine synthase